MSIRSIIRNLIPKSILVVHRKRFQKKIERKNQKQRFDLYNDYYQFDLQRNLLYSNYQYTNDTEEKLVTQIIIVYHTIEKGLTMGNTRLGFGEEKMERLLDLCITYLDKFNNKHNMFCEAIGVINNYNQLHLAANYKLNNQLQEKINQVLNQVESSNYTADQLNFTSETYFQHKNASFDLFSKSRHSLRDFKDNGTVELEILEKAVELAQKAPSTCNRQSTRVHIINNKDLIEKTLNLQTGNRGFGDRSSKLIILTSDLQCWESPTLRHGPYFDGGIFTMNLLYALHFYKIGACALNWFATIENDSQLRKFINLPDNEIILVIIGCGEVKEQFKIAKSRRRDIKSIFKVH